MDRLEQVLSRLPEFYNKELQDSKIRAIVKAFTDEMAVFDTQKDIVDSAIGIDGTTGTDLDNRWGALLGLPRRAGEPDSIYRNRMKTSVTDLVGGTEHALKYCIAVAMGINDDPLATESRIKVMDAWLYEGPELVDKSNGSVVCTVDLDGAYFNYAQGIQDVVERAIADTKAAGTNVQVLFINYRVMTHAEMQSLTYMELSAFRYNQLGNTK